MKYLEHIIEGKEFSDRLVKQYGIIKNKIRIFLEYQQIKSIIKKEIQALSSQITNTIKCGTIPQSQTPQITEYCKLKYAGKLSVKMTRNPNLQLIQSCIECTKWVNGCSRWVLCCLTAAHTVRAIYLTITSTCSEVLVPFQPPLQFSCWAT